MAEDKPTDSNSSDKSEGSKELEEHLSTPESLEDVKGLLQAKLAGQKRLALITMVVGLLITGTLLFIFWPRPEVIVTVPPQESPNTRDTSEHAQETPSAMDTFKGGSLSGWSHDVLNTWATSSHDYGVTVHIGKKVAFIQGGISNGGGGNQAVVRQDLSGRDMQIKCEIKLDIRHGSRVNGGLVARYQSIGEGYGSTIIYDRETGKAHLRLERMEGTVPGSNYKYRVKKQLLSGPILLSGFNPREWHELELEVKGSQIVVRIDGRKYIETRDSAYTYGAPGLLFGGSNGKGRVYYDNFRRY